MIFACLDMLMNFFIADHFNFLLNIIPFRCSIIFILFEDIQTRRAFVKEDLSEADLDKMVKFFYIQHP